MRNSNNQFSKKISLAENGLFGSNLIQSYATLYLMISPEHLFEMFQDDGVQQVGESNVSQFFKTNFFLGQINQNLYILQVFSQDNQSEKIVLVYFRLVQLNEELALAYNSCAGGNYLCCYDYFLLYAMSYYIRAANNEPFRVTPSATSG